MLPVVCRLIDLPGSMSMGRGGRQGDSGEVLARELFDTSVLLFSSISHLTTVWL